MYRIVVGFDAVRGILLGTRTLLPVNTEILLLLIFMVLMILFGLWVFRLLERNVRRRGTLGQH